MKKIFLIINLLPMLVFSQKYLTKNGTVNFEASVSGFEEVKASNKNASCVLNTENGEIASLTLMKGFKFKVALMEEHFNENYAESDQYPKAIFKGVVKNFDIKNISTTPKTYTITGSLELHGTKKDIITEAKIVKVGNQIQVLGTLEVKPEDFNIKIPSAVGKKIAKTIEIKFDFNLDKQK